MVEGTIAYGTLVTHYVSSPYFLHVDSLTLEVPRPFVFGQKPLNIATSTAFT
jgi:hypothetical protein